MSQVLFTNSSLTNSRGTEDKALIVKNLIKIFKNYWSTGLIIAILLVYFFNLFIDVMEIDAAQYALISMEMSISKSFLHVYLQGHDYLDKPPLLFWLSSLSFIFFGISNFSYKMPSILFAILAIYSLYRFSILYYNKEKAVLASLILASSQALFLITNDVRTDTVLLGLEIFSIWQLCEFLKKSAIKNLILASLGFGGAMMAKGPIALIIPSAAFGTEFILKREWKNIFRIHWLFMLIIISITLIPMSYGLYTQFDLHPEKFVYGLHGPSGLRFFYWTQSFGRITGENYWKDDSGYFYFLHTILWDFQPWIFLFIPALILKIRNLFANRFKAENKPEFISLGGFVLVFIALSLSKYKLPYYIFVIFPFASIITADFICQLKGKLQSGIARLQFGIMHLFWLLIVINFLYFFPPVNLVLTLFLALLFITNWLIYKNLKFRTERIYIPTLITAIGFNLMMSLNFYPNLLRYQSTSMAGKMVSENEIPTDKFYQYHRDSYALDFYANRITPGIDMDKIPGLSKGTWLFTSEKGITELNERKLSYKVIEVYPSFKVTSLNLTFLNMKTRNQSIKYDYLIEIQ